MLDRIFGPGEEELEELKDELERRNREVEELRGRLDEMERELERERERAKEAITEKQGTDRELKEAEHRIESLEDRIRNLEEAEEGMEGWRRVESLGRTEALSLLDELEGLRSEEGSLETHYLEDPGRAGDEGVARALREIGSGTGYVHLRDGFGVINCVLVPPIPLEDDFHRGERLRLEGIRGVLESGDKRIGFISAHAGKSAVGLLEGTRFTDFKIVRTRVKGGHSKGGYSQGRFERLRDEQIREHLKELLETADELIEDPDYVILDGNEGMVSELRDELHQDAQIIERSLDIGSVSGGERGEYAERILGVRLYVL